MGIWIRSQDKEKLINVNNNFSINCVKYYMDDETRLKSIKYGIYGDDVKLGIYSYKAKALKVLDEIQECIESNNSHHNSQWDNTPHLVYNVFQMPHDEVE